MGQQDGPETSPTLLRQLRDTPGDADSSGRFVLRYGPVIYQWSLQKLGSHDAEDVTQEVLWRMLQKLRTFEYDPGRSFHGYLRKVTLHACADVANSRHRPGRGSGDSAVHDWLHQLTAREDLVVRLGETFDMELFEEACLRVRRRIDARRWEAFRLQVLEQVAGSEVARQLGMKMASVFGAARDVRKMLRDEIRELEQGEE